MPGPGDRCLFRWEAGVCVLAENALPSPTVGGRRGSSVEGTQQGAACCLPCRRHTHADRMRVISRGGRACAQGAGCPAW